MAILQFVKITCIILKFETDGSITWRRTLGRS